MRGYEKINKFSACDGDIARIVESVFDESICAKTWCKNFITQVRYYRIDDVRNNGTCHGHDAQGNFKLFHLLDKKIDGVYRRATT